MLKKLVYILLLPFSIIYDLVTRVRNFLFNHYILKSNSSPIFTINVGNLRVGGTGKTPHVEYLISYFLKKKLHISTLSRGYGRKTNGFVEANEKSTSKDIGDEPKQLYSKFGQKINVNVDENRWKGLIKIASNHPKTEVVILDDAYQHRAVNTTLNILLSDFQKPFYADYLMPSGRLREAPKGAKRADLIIITKCPEMMDANIKSHLIKKTKEFCSPHTPVLFSSLSYDEPIALNKNNLNRCRKKVVLLSGIAQAELFCSDISKKYQVIKHFDFPDHHFFTENDLLKIQPYLNDEISVLMTEKDSIKIKEISTHPLILQSLFYIPIKVVFSVEDETILNNIIQSRWEKIYQKLR